MREHILAITALLAPLGRDVHYGDVPTRRDGDGRVVLAVTYPYVLLWSSSGRPGAEDGLSQPRTDIEDVLGVTAVAETPGAVLLLQEQVRPLLDRSRPDVAGRSVRLVLYDSQQVAVDYDVTLPSGRHPAYGVDLYRLYSTPAQEAP